MGMVATTLAFAADTSLISSTSQTEPSRVLFIIFTISSSENSIKLHPLSSCLLAFIINHMNYRSRGQVIRASQQSFSSSPPRPKKLGWQAYLEVCSFRGNTRDSFTLASRRVCHPRKKELKSVVPVVR